MLELFNNPEIIDTVGKQILEQQNGREISVLTTLAVMVVNEGRQNLRELSKKVRDDFIIEAVQTSSLQQ